MSSKRTLIASVLMILTFFGAHHLNFKESVPLKKPFSAFPIKIDDWIGREQPIDMGILDVLGADDLFYANYVLPGTGSINFYVGYYGSQREGDLIHSPKNCLPGAGWKITHRSTVEISIPENNSGKIKVAKLIIEKGSQKQIVLYWFQSRGRFIASEYMQKIYLVIDSITRNRTDGTFVRLVAPIVNDDEEKTLKTLEGFSRTVISVLEQYIPS